MADSKQLRILKKLTAHLEGVNPDTPAEDGPNGQPYTFDLRGKIVRGRSVIPVDEAEDMVSILEFPRQEIYTPVGEHGIVRQETWMLMLQGWPKDDPENPSDPAYAMKAEVEHRLARIVAEKSQGRGPVYPNEFMLGEHQGQREIMSLTIAPGVVRPPEDAASRLAMFYMPLMLGVRINVANPY
jgi:hypothetical protein